MGALFRAHDWTASPLGAAGTWPQSLRSVVGLLLGSKFPMFAAWGPDLTFLYNDRPLQRPVCRDPRQEAPARPREALPGFQDIWPEIWHDISPLVATALSGEATYHEDLPLLVNRRGFDEKAWFTFSYSPVRDESGAVAGMLATVVETTGKVRAEAALQASEARWQGLFEGMQEGILVAELVRDGSGRAVDWRYLAMNAAWETVTGWSRAATVGRTLLEVLPAVEPAWIESFVQVAGTGVPANFEGGVALLGKHYSVCMPSGRSTTASPRSSSMSRSSGPPTTGRR